MQKSQRPTIKEIAERAGTSIGTVDRALSNRSGISPATKQRVLQIAAELGYTPNKLASALGRKRALRIGVVSAENPSGFYSYIEQGVRRAAEDLADYSVEAELLLTPVLSPQEQKTLLENLDISRFDGLAVNSGGAPSTPLINRFVQSGLPVITFNSDAPGSERLFFIGTDSRQAGQLGGEMMGKFLNSRGSVAVIGNFAGTNTFIDRFGGFCEVVQSLYPGIAIVPCAECHSYSEKAFEIITALLRQNPAINGIFAAGYSATVGAMQALKAANRPDVRLIGYDLSTATRQGLEEGWCTAILYQDPFEQGYQAVRLLVRHLLEGWLPPQNKLLIDPKAIFRYNMANYTKSRLSQDPFR